MTTPTQQVEEAMKRIRSWCEKNGDARLVFACMNPPASDAELDAAEARIGRTLPEDVRALYRIANGQDEDAEANEDGREIGLIPSSEYGDLAHLLVPLDELNPAGWDEGWVDGWIGFATNYGGDMIVFDLSPGSPHSGRVLHFLHDYGAAALRLADSVAAQLSTLADDLEAGRVVYDEDAGLTPTREHAVDLEAAHEDGRLESHIDSGDDS